MIGRIVIIVIIIMTWHDLTWQQGGTKIKE